jgi:hypothetical protein
MPLDDPVEGFKRPETPTLADVGKMRGDNWTSQEPLHITAIPGISTPP